MRRLAGDCRRFTPAVLATAALTGCAADDSLFSGKRIIADLERQGIPSPDQDGRAPTAQGRAELPGSGPITLADLLAAAEARSPDLAAARSSVGVAAGEAWQASLYPNPSLDFEAEDISWEDGVSDSKTTIGVTQPIILGDRRKAAMQAADAERAARLAEVDSRRRALYGDIAVLHARLVSLREQERLYGELRDLAGRSLAAAQTRFDAKAATETEVIRPRVEVYRIEAALARLNQEQRAAAGQLGPLIGGLAVDAARLEAIAPGPPGSLDLAHLRSEVRRTHPALAAADRAFDAAQARFERTRAETTPDLDVRIAAGYRGESDDGIVEVGAGIAIPLWDAREGDRLSARFAMLRARQQRVAAENDLLGRLAAAVGEYEAARVQWEAFRDRIVPDAQRAFDQSGEGYRAGRNSFLELLDSQRTLTEARVTQSELAGAVLAARARVMQIVGPDGLRPGPAAAEQGAIPQDKPVERPQGAEVQP